MQVLIMRHGEAVIDAPSDSLRPLTDDGREESRQMALWLAKQTINIEQVLVSPYVRAQQTLDVVRQGLALPAGQETLSILTPGGDVDAVHDHLRELAQQGVKGVILVSHLPLVGYLVAELCPGLCPPMFAPSAITCISLDAQGEKGKVDWQISPSNLCAKVC